MFAVGDRVICVDDEPDEPLAHIVPIKLSAYVRLGQVYTIRKITQVGSRQALHLEGITGVVVPNSTLEYAFNERRFRLAETPVFTTPSFWTFA